MNSYCIRAANEGDVHDIALVHVKSWKEAYSDILPPEYLTNINIDEKYRFWLKVVKNSNLVYVAEAVGKVIGFANGGLNRSLETNYPGELYAIYLLSEFQGHGIGMSLFNKVKQYLIDNKMYPFISWVFINNPAYNFYLYMGAKAKSSKIERYYGASIEEVMVVWE